MKLEYTIVSQYEKMFNKLFGHWALSSKGQIYAMTLKFSPFTTKQSVRYISALAYGSKL